MMTSARSLDRNFKTHGGVCSGVHGGRGCGDGRRTVAQTIAPLVAQTVAPLVAPLVTSAVAPPFMPPVGAEKLLFPLTVPMNNDGNSTLKVGVSIDRGV